MKKKIVPENINIFSVLPNSNPPQKRCGGGEKEKEEKTWKSKHYNQSRAL